MSSKALLILVMFLATTLLISAEVAPKDFDENIDERDGKLATNGVDESKYGYGGGWGYGRPWYGGYGGYGGRRRGGYGGYGPWRGGYGWGRRCTPYGCYYPHKRVEANTDAKPHN